MLRHKLVLLYVKAAKLKAKRHVTITDRDNTRQQQYWVNVLKTNLQNEGILRFSLNMATDNRIV